MDDRIRTLLDDIRALEDELKSALHQRESQLFYRLNGRRRWQDFNITSHALACVQLLLTPVGVDRQPGQAAFLGGEPPIRGAAFSAILRFP